MFFTSSDNVFLFCVKMTGLSPVMTAVSACPYCLQMFEDAIKAKEAAEKLKAQDIAELVATSLE